MAIQLKFQCSENKKDHLSVDSLDEMICIFGSFNDEDIEFLFDKSTSIKLAKTLRTEINKI